MQLSRRRTSFSSLVMLLFLLHTLLMIQMVRTLLLKIALNFRGPALNFVVEVDTLAVEEPVLHRSRY